MTDQLETRLRTALNERAAHVPASATTRLTGIDYRPRTRRLKSPIAVGGFAGAAGTAGVLLALTGGATDAFAGWTPKPTIPVPRQLAAAVATCNIQSPIAGLPLKLTDTRGPFTFEVYANSRQSATCVIGPSFTSVTASQSSGPVTVPAGKIQLSTAHTTSRDGHAYAFAEGRTGAGVSAVTLLLTDGTKLAATVSNGWYVAWWPGTTEAKSAELATPSGVRTQKLDRSHESPCGANLCTGGRVGTGNGPVTSSSSGSQISAGFSTSKP